MGTTYSECVPIALLIEHAKRMRLTKLHLSSVLSLVVPLFSTLCHKYQGFQKRRY